jgi:hypothetical protein
MPVYRAGIEKETGTVTLSTRHGAPQFHCRPTVDGGKLRIRISVSNIEEFAGPAPHGIEVTKKLFRLCYELTDWKKPIKEVHDLLFDEKSRSRKAVRHRARFASRLRSSKRSSEVRCLCKLCPLLRRASRSTETSPRPGIPCHPQCSRRSTMPTEKGRRILGVSRWRATVPPEHFRVPNLRSPSSSL